MLAPSLQLSMKSQIVLTRLELHSFVRQYLDIRYLSLFVVTSKLAEVISRTYLNF